jgi:AsmA-like C-terminal region/AsmA family
MKKLLKIFGILAGVGVVVVIAAGVAAYFLIDKELITEQVIRPIEEKINRKISYGSISPKLMGGVGIELTDVHLGENPRFGEGDFISFKRIGIGVKLMPYIKDKKIEVDEIAMDGLEVSLIKAQDGTFNFLDLTQLTATTEPVEQVETPDAATEPTGPPRMPDALKGLDISGIELTNMHITLQDYQMAAQAVQRTEPPANSAPEAAAESAPAEPAPVEGEAAAAPEGEPEYEPIADEGLEPVKLEIDDFDVIFENITVTKPIKFHIAMQIAPAKKQNFLIDGVVGPLPEVFDMENIEKIPLKLAVKIDKFDIPAFRAFYEQAAPVILKSAFFSIDLSVDGSLAKGLTTTGGFSLENLVFAMKNAGAYSQPINIHYNHDLFADLGSEKIKIKKLDLSVNNLALNLSGGVDYFKTPEKLNLDVKLNSNTFDPIALAKAVPMVASNLPPELSWDGGMTIGLVSKGSPNSIDATLDVNIDAPRIAFGDVFAKPSGVPFNLKVAVAYRKTYVDISTLNFNFNTLALSLAAPGKVNGLGTDAMAVDFDIVSAPMTLNNWAGMLPALREFAPTGAIAINIGAHGAVSAGPPVAGKLLIQNVGATVAALAVPISETNGDIEFSYRKAAAGPAVTAKVNSFSTKIGASDISMQANLHSISPLDADVTINSSNLDVDQMMPPAPASASSGQQQQRQQRAAPQPCPPFENTHPLKGKKLKATVRFNHIKARGIVIDNLKIDARINREVATLSRFFMKIFNGTVSASGNVNMAGNLPKFKINTNITRIDINKAISDLSDMDDTIYGRFSANLTNLTGRGACGDDIKRSLNGRGDMKLEEGKLSTFNLVGGIASSMPRPLRSVFPGGGGGETNMQTVEAAITIEDGKVKSDDLGFGRPRGTETKLRGYFDLFSNLNYRGTYFLDRRTSRRAGTAGQVFAGRDGRIKVPFRLTGTFSDPNLTVDTGNMTDRLRDAATRRAREEVGKLKDKAVDRGRKALDKQLKGRGGSRVKKARDLLGF